MLHGAACYAFIAQPSVQGPLSKLFTWMLAGACARELEWEEPDFVIVIDAAIWPTLDALRKERLMYHELRHIAARENEYGVPTLDKEGRAMLKLVPHDAEFFHDEVSRYGLEVCGLEETAIAIAEGIATDKPREASQNIDGFQVAPERVRPSYHPVLRAFIALVEDGKAPTVVNLALKLSRSRQAVHQMFARHPDLLAWIDRHIQAANVHYTGVIIRRAAMLGAQGSDKHMDIFLKHQGGHYARSAPGDMGNDQGALPGGQQVVVNLLVPRPEYPQGAIVQAPTLRLPPPDLPPQLGGGR
jgi:hypothetical protein